MMPKGRTCRSDHGDGRMRFHQPVRQNPEAARVGHRGEPPLPRPTQGRLPDAPQGNQLEHAHAADDGQGLFPRGRAHDRSRR